MTGPAHHPERRLALEGLAVNAAFAGDDSVRAFDQGVEINCVQDHIYAFFEPGIREGEEGAAQSSRSSGAGNRGYIPAQRSRYHRREVLQSAVEYLHLFGGSSFLRSEYICRTLPAAERGIDVAGNGEDGFVKARIHPGTVDAGDLRKRLAARRQLPAVPVEETVSQSGEHAHSTIVRGAPAYPHKEAVTSFTQGVSNHFSRTESTGFHGVAFRG